MRHVLAAIVASSCFALALPCSGAALTAGPASGVPADGEGWVLLTGAARPELLEIDGRALALPEGPLPWSVTGLSPGFQTLRVVVGGRSLRAVVRTIPGSVLELDLSEFTESHASAVAPGFELDLFAFHDELDAATSPDARARHCDRWRSLAPIGPVREVIDEACAAPPPVADDAALPLAEEPAPVPNANAWLSAVVRPDGSIRRQPRGAGTRIAIAFGSGLGAGVSFAAAIDQERRAALAQVARRDAERYADHVMAGRHLHEARAADDRRDAAIAAGVAFSVALIVDAVVDLAERRRFTRLRRLVSQ